MTAKMVVKREVDEVALIKNAALDGLKAAMFAIHNTVSARSPLDTGNLVGSLQPGAGVTEVDPNGEWARVGTNVDYGRTLNESRDTHYRDHKSHAGEPTLGWFERGVADADISDTVSIMAQSIESGWKA